MKISAKLLPVTLGDDQIALFSSVFGNNEHEVTKDFLLMSAGVGFYTYFLAYDIFKSSSSIHEKYIIDCAVVFSEYRKKCLKLWEEYIKNLPSTADVFKNTYAVTLKERDHNASYNKALDEYNRVLDDQIIKYNNICIPATIERDKSCALLLAGILGL